MSEWRPIETAPRDGTEVLLLYAGLIDGDDLVINGWWDSVPGREFEATWEHAMGHGDADYWMPLPAPPTRADPPE